jgi:hypothetical protein
MGATLSKSEVSIWRASSLGMSRVDSSFFFAMYWSRVRVLSSSSSNLGLRSAFSPSAPSAAGAAGVPLAAPSSGPTAQSSVVVAAGPHSALASVSPACSAFSSGVPSSAPQPLATFLSESLRRYIRGYPRRKHSRDTYILPVALCLSGRPPR